MAKVDPSRNPYAPPRSPVEVVPVADVADSDGLQEDLTRAFYAATYGTVFLPGLGYCVALFLLAKTYLRRAEFSPQHHRSFTITAVVCLLLAPLALGAILAALILQAKVGVR